MRRVLLSILCAAVAMAGCGSDSATTGESWEPFRIPVKEPAPIRYERGLQPGASGLMGPELEPLMPDGPPPAWLAEDQLIEGIGNFSHPGSRVTVQYVAVEYGSGRKFASSWEEGKPSRIMVGKDEVIEGWEEALEKAEVADRTELVIPPELTQGPFPPDVPKGSTVILIFDLLRSEYPSEIREREAASRPQT